MMPFARGLACCSLLWLTGMGCAHFVESRAIERFAKSLEEQDLRQVKDSASPEFANKALRTATALQDFRILRLPDGKVSIVDVEQVSDTMRRVNVTVGENDKEVFYELILNDNGKWVVNDLYLKQKKMGVTAYKSVTDQMDLLLTVREFLDAWGYGDREQVLASTGANLRKELERIPPTYLATLSRRVVGDHDASSSFKPEAQLEESTAVVKLPRKSGGVVLTLENDKTGWSVVDVAVDAPSQLDRIPSVKKQAAAVAACSDFLAAYQNEDRETLQKVCDAEFYAGSLAVANLKEVALPAAELTEHELEVEVRAQRADIVLRGEQQVLQVDLRRQDAEDPSQTPQFFVRDVTLYDLQTRQEQRLSALFTARGMLELFCRSLAEKDLNQLRHTTTQDFSGRVWQRLNPATIEGLPLEPFQDANLVIEDVVFQGSLTRFSARQNGQPMTYVLREENGRFYVDDVQWQLPGRPASVKQTFDLLIPIRNFSAAVALGRIGAEQSAAIDILQQSCTGDFNRMVWQQTEFVPNGGLSADSFLDAALTSITAGDQEIIVQLGDNRFGATVRLRKESERYLVDDVLLVGGPEASQRVEMKRQLRTLLAHGQAVPPADYVRKSHRRQDNAVAKSPKASSADSAVSTKVVAAKPDDFAPGSDDLTSNGLDGLAGHGPSRLPAAATQAKPLPLDEPLRPAHHENWDDVGAVSVPAVVPAGFHVPQSEPSQP
jgi:hypothetical protein